MTFPDFLIIGAPKCGTTSLAATLAEHPGIHFLDKKEAAFFNLHYDRGPDWYAGLFKGAAEGQLIGEGTPAYAMLRAPENARRIHALMPDVKLIYMVREPYARIESHYLQDLANGMPDIGLSKAVLTRDYLVETSRYHARLEDFRACFPDEQIHIIFFEELLKDYRGITNQCLRFIGAAELPEDEVKVVRTNTRENHTAPSGFLKKVKKSRFLTNLHLMMPRPLVNALRPLLRSSIDVSTADMRWTDEALAFAEAKIEPDRPLFLAHAGRPADYWTRKALKRA